jgi:hypothetical protein
MTVNEINKTTVETNSIKLLQSIINNSNSSIILLDGSLNVIYMNPYAKQHHQVYADNYKMLSLFSLYQFDGNDFIYDELNEINIGETFSTTAYLIPDYYPTYVKISKISDDNPFQAKFCLMSQEVLTDIKSFHGFKQLWTLKTVGGFLGVWVII